jgi:hypothetical protein
VSFRRYLYWEGALAMALGAAMLVFGLSKGHETPGDAVIGGCIMVAGTGLFMTVRHKVRFAEPAAWFTSKPMAGARDLAQLCSRRRLWMTAGADSIGFAAAAVGLSYLTGFWLTYMDMGVWALVIGAVKLGPSQAAIADREHRLGVTYSVARRPVRGLVELSQR